VFIQSLSGLIISSSSSRDDSNGSLVVTLSLWIRIWIWNVTSGLDVNGGVDLVELIGRGLILRLDTTANR